MPPAPILVPPDSYEAALRFLEERVNFERAVRVPYQAEEFRLDRVRGLLARLGDPHLRLPIVHIAGTKGKGSTAAITGAILSAAGFRTGVFTSPHLHHVEERIAIDGRPISPGEFASLLARVAPAVQAMDRQAAASPLPHSGPTYFDITTAMGLLCFVEHHVAAAVLEVGLGGRLDSTNVCQPRVSVVTSISFDHTTLLGGTLQSIAREKAGIIKPGVPVVSGVLAPEPRQVIREVAQANGCRLVELGTDFDVRYAPPHSVESTPGMGRIDYQYRVAGREHEYHDLPLGLLGRHQAGNAAVALAALAELQAQGWAIPEAALRKGLANVVWPARVELISRSPAIVIDAAHNLASVEALTRVLEESFSVPRRVLVFATTQEKDVRGMLGVLLRRFDRVLFTRYLSNPRAVPPAELAAIAKELTGDEYPVYQQPAAAWDALRAMVRPDDLVCVTGSFYIAAEMREQIARAPLG